MNPETCPAPGAELKPGTQTSSFKVLVLTIVFAFLMPLPPLAAALLVERGYLPGAVAPAVELYLSQVLALVAALFGVSGFYAIAKAVPTYIVQRGEVSKIKALAAVGSPGASPSPAQAEPKGDQA